MSPNFPVQSVRRMFPALNRRYKGYKVVYFDGPGGSQVVQPAVDAMVRYMTDGGANLHGAFSSSVETEAMIADARRLAAAFLHANPDEIAFGPNMTTLNLSISRALSRTWQPGDEIVVTELDHRANVDPWIRAAQDKGVAVKWLRVDPDTLTLDLDALAEVITERTKLVAVGLASNGVGTITDVARVAKRAHAVGALVSVDAVHAAPHIVVDRNRLGADIVLCSAYKFFGPHLGIAAVKREVFESLDVYKLKPAPDYIPDKLETGTQNHEGLAGLIGALRFIADLGHGLTLRTQLTTAMERIEGYEDSLARRMRQELSHMSGVTLYSAGDTVHKTPTIAFSVEGMAPRAVSETMAENYGIFVADGDFYASTVVERLGLQESGGFVRAGLAPYNTENEVNRFLEALKTLTRA
ncbi:cysteine desulfurase-like protein [Alicyclobacillus sp. SO9]|nr:cysteine desulfurase-like protein [Alicyclobacillus sp. SO9]